MPTLTARNLREIAISFFNHCERRTPPLVSPPIASKTVYFTGSTHGDSRVNILNANGLGSLFAQQNNDAAGAGILAGLMIYLVIVFALAIISIVGMWKVFEKAGQPGWAAIVPFYNLYILTVEVAKKEILWFILLVIGFVVCGPLALIALFVVNIEVAKKFGKDALFGIGLTLLGFIFYPILGFGSAQYASGKKRRSRDDVDEDDNW
ncbi:hypothetical protein J8F10_28950 [Gemmata sp. G18]|uniref:Signal peptidase I n=1 Tax=Gemmata palustris TaxID=2822762 RepID=A0ABS5C0W6_9BACT|nr:DUF5684 domain-containing protein [Gemmata palustris]MBP3959292.1 hypothetical protein [Gemmata palustris]